MCKNQDLSQTMYISLTWTSMAFFPQYEFFKGMQFKVAVILRAFMKPTSALGHLSCFNIECQLGWLELLVNSALTKPKQLFSVVHLVPLPWIFILSCICMQWITAACIWLQFAQADGETAVTALNNKILKPVQVALMILLHTCLLPGFQCFLFM